MFKRLDFQIFFPEKLPEERYYEQPCSIWGKLIKNLTFSLCFITTLITFIALLRCLGLVNIWGDLSLLAYADDSINAADAEYLRQVSENASLNNLPFLDKRYYQPRTYVPRNQLEKDVIKAGYKGGIDPLFARVFEVFQTNQRFLVAGYLSYNGNFDFLKGQVDSLTEEGIFKLCLEHISPKYIVNIAIAGVLHFDEFSPDWAPPAGYLQSPAGHPGLAYGPNFVGWVPWEYVTQAVEAAKAVDSNASSFVKQAEELRKAKFYLPVTFKENFALFHQDDLSKFEVAEKLRHIFTTNLKYLLYLYVCYNDSILRRSPIWTEEALFLACLELPANYIFEVVETGRLHFDQYSTFWQPPVDYLKTKPFYHGFTLLPDFTGAIPTNDIFVARTPYEAGLVDRFYTKSQNRDLFRQIYHIFTTNQRYLVYNYAAYHDVVLHNGPGEESAIHKVCMTRLEPQFIVDVVNAAKSNIPGFDSSGTPDPFCLTLNLYQPGFKYGPGVFPLRAYIFFGIIFLIALGVPIKLADQNGFDD